ncbi:DUF4276 family protein [Variovorax sp.]|uniref:DUF4276 family protein n=1 Tax=Variovorax sp. TaxID=1871043 RepID=UPI000C37D9BA|nr:DUF4276 family protein [Variovorax sp.]MBS80351.1 hypothetical protein [Variovorax sp.]
MKSVACIVEGDGEVAALPVLLRRICEWKTPEIPTYIPPPIRVYKDRFLNREGEFRRHLLLAAAKCGESGWVLVVLDADDDCPKARGAEILARAQIVIPHRRIAVVLANREYEAWFIAAARSLHGVRSFKLETTHSDGDAELPRNAKGWMSKRMGGAGYNETTDQPAFSAQLDLQQAFDASRSFRKLCSEWEKHQS